MATAARGKHFDFSDPVIGYSTRFFYMKDAHPDGFDWKELADFKPYKIGGVRGYWYEDAFVAAELNVHFVSTDIQIIQLLTKGRIDFTLMDELAGWALIEEMYPGQKGSFAVAEKPESSAPLRLMVSRKYPDAGELTARFNKGLKTVMKNGTYDKILQHYGVPPKYAISE